MNGKRTLLILGAGASACYDIGGKGIPIQNDILNSFVFPKASKSPGLKVGGMILGDGLTYSTFLAEYLHEKFNLKGRGENKLTEFWKILSAKGLNLESLYDELEKDKSEVGIKARNYFLAILMTKIRDCVGTRSENNGCIYHKKLVRNLEPLDYIISFNWDTLIDDALLYECPFWFPYTGYGLNMVGLQGDFFNKIHQIQSLIHLYHIHGSIGLYEPLDEEVRKKIRAALVVGPRGFALMHELVDLAGLKEEADEMKSQKKQGQLIPKRKVSDEELFLIERGCFRFGQKKKMWFQPIFVTPSKTKPEYKNWYVSTLKKMIYSKLPYTEQIIIAGYSFPPADVNHMKYLFVEEIINEDAQVICINLENKSKEYKDKVRLIFPKNKIDFSILDFKIFCNKLKI